MVRSCLGYRGHPCPWGRLLARGSRCPDCARAAERARRPGTTARGYGATHQRARKRLALTLPAPCGYCRELVLPGSAWAAAHVVDGDPTRGWMAAHGGCNERAKVAPLF